MGSRLELHSELLKFLPKVYYQPPASINMEFPCIVYHKTEVDDEYANNRIYKQMQAYEITVIDKNPDSVVPDNINEYFPYSSITQFFATDNLNHTALTLYY